MVALRVGVSALVLLGTASAAFAWSDAMDRVVRRRQSVIVSQFSLLKEFCQPGHIGRIGIDPAPKLGTLRIETGTSMRNPACPGVAVPYSRVTYVAGRTAGDDAFTLWVTNGESLEPIKVTVTVR
jgi:hypothetical protein